MKKFMVGALAASLATIGWAEVPPSKTPQPTRTHTEHDTSQTGQKTSKVKNMFKFHHSKTTTTTPPAKINTTKTK